MEKNLNLNRTLVAMAALVIVFAGLKLAAEIVVPFLLTLFIAIICSPVIKVMTQRKVPHGIAIALLFILILIVFFFLAGLINSSVQEFTRSIPQYKVLLSERINDVTALAQKLKLPIVISHEAIMKHFDPSVIMNFVSRLLLNFSGVLSNAFVLILVVTFMLFEAPTMKHKFALVLSNNEDDVVAKEHHIDRVLDSVIRYLGVKTFISLLSGISTWILLDVLGVQYAILWGTLTFLLNYIPNIGSIIAAVPVIVQALLLNGFGVAIGVTAGTIALNVAFGNIIEPKMMGKTLGLSTLVVFFSLLFWGWMFGSVGMLLSVPLTMALKITLDSSESTKKYAALLADVNE